MKSIEQRIIHDINEEQLIQVAAQIYCAWVIKYGEASTADSILKAKRLIKLAQQEIANPTSEE